MFRLRNRLTCWKESRDEQNKKPTKQERYPARSSRRAAEEGPESERPEKPAGQSPEDGRGRYQRTPAAARHRHAARPERKAEVTPEPLKPFSVPPTHSLLPPRGIYCPYNLSSVDVFHIRLLIYCL